MMEAQLEEGRREMEVCERVKTKVEEVLGQIQKEGGGGGSGSGKKGEDVRKVNGTTNAGAGDEHAKRLWKMMTDIGIEAD